MTIALQLAASAKGLFYALVYLSQPQATCLIAQLELSKHSFAFHAARWAAYLCPHAVHRRKARFNFQSGVQSLFPWLT